MKKSLQKTVATGAMAFAFTVSLIASTLPTLAAPTSVGVVNGNNGTLKVHEIGTLSGTENNDPKVCKFNIESFGLDKGQTGYLMFDVQGQDRPNGVATDARYAFGAANTDGYAVSQNFNSGGVTIADGHYKVTLYGKDTSKKNADLDEVKAKSKVFKVECATDETKPETPVKPVSPAKPVKPVKPENPNKPEVSEPPVKPETPGVENNGTLKVHEIGTPVKTMNNDPKVCAFDLEGFKFDKGQTGYLKFSVQGKDSPLGVAPEAVYAFGPTDEDGYAISNTKFNTVGGVNIANGHYKVTLYGKADLKDEKAKSKVFKVTCDTDRSTPTIPSTPTTPTTPVSNGGQVLGSSTAAINTVASAKGGSLVNTGTTIASTALVASSIIMAAWFIMKKRAGLSQEKIDMIAL